MTCYVYGTDKKVEKIHYAILKRFSPEDGKSWKRYLKFSKLNHLKEIVGIDASLCPSIIKVEDYSLDDWSFSSDEINFIGFFADLNHTRKRVGETKNCQIVAVVKNPKNEDWLSQLENSFIFKGYDLVDDGLISALTNCGGFPETFSNSELNEWGLIADYMRACEIKEKLKANNPMEPHAVCELYGVARLETKT